MFMIEKCPVITKNMKIREPKFIADGIVKYKVVIANYDQKNSRHEEFLFGELTPTIKGNFLFISKYTDQGSRYDFATLEEAKIDITKQWHKWVGQFYEE
jgi:hypothetical protein